MKYSEFLRIAGLLNQKLQITPLLFGSLGLERRLDISLNADDIDILIPESFLGEDWNKLYELMEKDGYILVDEEEHEFEKEGVTAAFASIEGLTPFAGVDISNIPTVTESGTDFLLLELPDYLKVYEASSKDGYRQDVKNKQDTAKIELIKKALGEV